MGRNPKPINRKELKLRFKEKGGQGNNYKTKSDPNTVMSKLVHVYQCARDGLTVNQIAEVIGVHYITFLKWRKLYPQVQEAIDRGRMAEQQVIAGKFRDYIHDKLPIELRKLWAKILEAEKKPRLRDRMRRMLDNRGKIVRQQLFLYALIHHDFNPSAALSRVHIRKAVYDEWLGDPEFAKLVEEIEWHKENYFEEAVVDLVKQRNPAIVKFAAQSKLAHRGYGPKKKIVEKNVHVSGGVAHSHVHRPLAIEDLKLSTDEMAKLLDSMREAKEKQLPPRVVKTEVVLD